MKPLDRGFMGQLLLERRAIVLGGVRYSCMTPFGLDQGSFLGGTARLNPLGFRCDERDARWTLGLGTKNMTAQEADSLKIGDRVQTGTRTGVVEFVVSDVFLVKWDGGRDSDAYTREAFAKQFVPCRPNASDLSARP
jgi:hypothetical protein